MPALVLLGWTGPPVAAAATPSGPKQIAVADWPRGALLGLLDADGNVWADGVRTHPV